MKIIGIDPGTQFTGFGIVDFRNNSFLLVKSGVIKPKAGKSISERLEFIFDEITAQIKIHNPDQFAIETAFYGKNIQSALKIGYVRGISLLAASKAGLPIGEYSPREVKKSVVGNGAASKEQVQYMIKKLLTIRTEKMQFDESDALAVAVCHAFQSTSPKGAGGNWKKFASDNPDRIIGG